MQMSDQVSVGAEELHIARACDRAFDESDYHQETALLQVPLVSGATLLRNLQSHSYLRTRTVIQG